MTPLFIPTRDRRPRRSPVRLIVVHVNVGPEYERSAIDIAKFTQHEQGGYHEVVDDHIVVVTANDDEVVNGAGGVNDIAWHICLIGEASQTAAQWADPYSTSELSLAASRVAAAAKRLGVPVVKLDGTGVLNALAGAAKGICGHADVSQVEASSLGHWDPGPNFPWASFLNQVTGHPVPPSKPEEQDMRGLWQPSGKLTAGKYAGHQPIVLVDDVNFPIEGRILANGDEYAWYAAKLGKPHVVPVEFVENLCLVQRTID